MQEIETRKDRSSNLELLRIISMILIVMSHSDEWMGLARLYQTDVGINKFITDWLHMGGQIGVGCFLLISGYFMIEQPFRLKRIFKLLGEVWFYTISIWIVYAVAKIIMGNFSYIAIFRQGITAFFPVLFSHYWFVTAYVILMFLSPFFNKLIEAMDKRMYQMFLATLIIIFCVIGGSIPGGGLSGMSEGRLIPVIIMYFIAGYIRKYADNNKDNGKKHLIIAVIGYLLLYATFVGIDILGDILNSEKIINYCCFWRPLNSPIVLVINVELFLAFLRMKHIKGKLINALASNTFGIYLIHANLIVSGKILPRLFPVYKETNSVKLFIYAVGSVITVYIVCTLIDVIRQKTVEKIWIKAINKKCDDFEDKIKNLIISLKDKFMVVAKKYYG